MGEPGAEKAKKAPRPGPPPPPPAVCAGALAVRVATARACGIPSSAGSLQATWVTEAGTGKVTMVLDSSRRAPFPKDSWAHAAMLDSIERDVKKLEGAPVRVVEFSEGQSYALLDGVLLECSTPVSAAVPSVAVVGRVSLDGKKKPDTMILLAGKKKNVSVKFSVTVSADEAGAAFSRSTAEEEKGLKEASRSSLEDGPLETLLPPVTEEDDDETTATRDAESSNKEMVVNPFKVVGIVDYDKLVKQFGSQMLSPELLKRFHAATIDPSKPMHRFLRRGIFFSHRDVDKICDCVESNVPFYLYTGRGPSSASMHLGHLVPFMMTQWLQEAFGVPLVIQMTDDEKFLWKGSFDETKREYNLDYYRKLTRENAKDIIACGFDKERTFLFSDCEYIGHMYPNIAKIWKSITYNTAKAAFGFDPQSNIGQSAFPAIQAAPSFASSFEIPLSNLGAEGGLKQSACLIPCAIDQDPYFRLTRDVAPKLAPTSHKLQGKPALIHSKFFPPLQGAEGKMSSSDQNAAIFLTDTPEQIESKIKMHAFSGGRQTQKEQREHGADLETDVSYQWLRFFLEDDELLKVIGDDYGSGKGEYAFTQAVKAKLIEILQDLVANHKARREKITEQEIDEWMAIRPLAPPLLRPRKPS